MPRIIQRFDMTSLIPHLHAAFIALTGQDHLPLASCERRDHVPDTGKMV